MFGHRIEEDVYDPTGVQSSVTKFVYNGDQIWATLDASNQVTERYVSLDGLDSAFARIGAAGGVGWLLADRLGSVHDIVNNSGQVIDHIDYDAWGNKINETQPANGDAVGYAGYWFDAAVEMDQDWHRFYNPQTERFTTKDPDGFAAGDSDLYRYVANDPTNATDPTGLEATYARRFWKAFSFTDWKLYVKAMTQLHHTKMQEFESLYRANGVTDIHAVENLRAVSASTHGEIRDLEKGFLDAELKKINKNWSWPTHAKQFLAHVENNPAASKQFFKELEVFRANMEKAYKGLWIKATDTATTVRSKMKPWAGKKAWSKVTLGKAKRLALALPKLVPALGFLSLFGSAGYTIASAGNHTPEQQEKWGVLEARYAAALQRAVQISMHLRNKTIWTL